MQTYSHTQHHHITYTSNRKVYYTGSRRLRIGVLFTHRYTIHILHSLPVCFFSISTERWEVSQSVFCLSLSIDSLVLCIGNTIQFELQVHFMATVLCFLVSNTFFSRFTSKIKHLHHQLKYFSCIWRPHRCEQKDKSGVTLYSLAEINKSSVIWSSS